MWHMSLLTAVASFCFTRNTAMMRSDVYFSCTWSIFIQRCPLSKSDNWRLNLTLWKLETAFKSAKSVRYKRSLAVRVKSKCCRFVLHSNCRLLFRSLAVLDPRVGHTMNVLSIFIPVPCHSDWLFPGEFCPRLDIVHPGRVWSSSPSCTWHCSLHYLFFQATPLFPHLVTIVC